MALASKSIQPIDKHSVHRICSGQVVLDLATAVKELVENSLDAGATSIEVKLKEYGGEMIEVSDNGSGVSPDNLQGLTLKYHTSKLSEFSDLQSITSFGFRGEALSSLCALGDVSILTKTRDDQTGSRISYDHSGLIVSQENAARPVGTTVYVGKLFSPLPVRHKEFLRNIRREYGRMVSILQGYALISKHVRLVCTNQIGKSSRSTVLRTQGSGIMKENIVTVFGPKIVASLVPVDLKFEDDLCVEGYVSKPGSGSGRASGDRQFFFVNGRPVDMPKISKMLNELYKSFNSQQYPMAVLNFRLPTSSYDVNVTPDKRRLFLHAESCFMSGLRSALGSFYAPDKYSFSIHEPEASPSQKSFTADSMTQIDEGPPVEATESEDADADELPVVSPSSTTAMDLSSFCYERATIVTPMKSPAEPASLRKSVQAKLTGFVSQTKRKMEDAELITEEESVLKKHAPDTDCRTPTLTSKKKSDCFFAATNPCSPTVGGLPEELLREDPVLKTRGGVTEQLLSEDPVLKTRAAGIGSTLSKAKCYDIFGRSNQRGATICEARKDPFATMNSEEPLLKKCAKSVKSTEEDLVSSSSIKSTEEDAVASSPAKSTEQDHSASSPGKSTKQDLTASVPQLAEGSQVSEEEIPAETNELFKEEFIEATRDEHASSKSESTGEIALVASSKKILTERRKQENDSGNSSQETREVVFNYETVRNRIRMGLVHYDRTSKSTSKTRGRFTSATVAESIDGRLDKEAALASATRELERSFNKSDFARMKILGQFNLGFIIARLEDDLFVIDQHASDEKYNFERLSKSTVLNKQPLLRPLPLHLSAAEEIAISTHMETFRRNGFDFIEKEDALPGERVSLTAVPFSKNVTFGASDVHELVSLVSDEAASFSRDAYLVRPTRVHAMLASRACRSSIMIGDALSKKEMEKVVGHLAELDAPWNCPHGRPTMRHLYVLSSKRREV